MTNDRGTVAFIFFGELFLIPHLLPIALALARRASPPRITAFVATRVHEEIIAEILAGGDYKDITIRRAKGFRDLPAGQRSSPKLPWKPLMLARNAADILRHDVAVVAERTSLWLPRIAPRGTSFIYNEHGAGPHANFAAKRNRFATKIMMPAPGMADRARAVGDPEAPIEVVGYIKRDYMRDTPPASRLPHFADKRPTVIYVPHWLQQKSSWWCMGEQVLDYFARSSRYNLIFAPHMRLPDADSAFQRRIERFRSCPNIHIDTDSYSLVDRSYIDAADIYLGEGSSQVVEFAERPRPAIFLNPAGVDWTGDPRFSHWTMGDVVGTIAEMDAALDRAAAGAFCHAAVQRAYVTEMMGLDDGMASERAADVILRVLNERLDAQERRAS